jgi:hypothetical protein
VNVRLSVIIAAIALVLAQLAPSAVHAAGYAGFRAGVNHAYFSGDTEETGLTGSREVFSGGLFLGWDTEGHLGFRTDLLYTMRGAKDDFGGEFKVDYMEMAPLLVYRQTLTPKFALRGFLGPMLGVFVNAEADAGPVDIDLGDIVKHWDVSGVIGVEVNMNAGPYVLLLDTRYTHGSRILEGEDLDGNPIDYNFSNVGIAVMAGLMVPF